MVYHNELHNGGGTTALSCVMPFVAILSTSSEISFTKPVKIYYTIQT